MAQLKTAVDRETLIQAVMDETGFDRNEAEFIVALDLGEIDGDIEFTGPMSLDERRTFGLDISIDEDVAPDPEDDADGVRPTRVKGRTKATPRSGS